MRRIRLIGASLVITLAASFGFTLVTPTEAQATPYDTFLSAPVGISPQAVAVSPDGSKAYVANNDSGSVSEVNTLTGAVLRTFTVGYKPSALAVTSDGREVFVTNYLDNTVTEIRLSDGITNTFLVGHWPTSIAISADNTVAYVTNSDSDSVSVIAITTDPETSWSTLVANVIVDGGPSAIALSPDGDTGYITLDQYNQFVSVDLTNSTFPVVKSIGVGSNPTSVVVSSDAQAAFVGDGAEDTVTAVWLNESTSAAMLIDGVVPVGDKPNALTFSPDMVHLYVTNSLDGTVSILNTSALLVEETLDVSTFTGGVAVSPDGTKIFVTAMTNSLSPGTLEVINVASPMVLTLHVTDVSVPYTLPIQGLWGTIGWGDGTFSNSFGTNNVHHSYSSTGNYLVTITGGATGYGDYIVPKRGKVTSVASWGDFASDPYFTTLDAAFVLESELTALPANFPAYVNSASYMFIGADLFNQDISTWDVSHLVNMEGMFSAAMNFNADIGNWDISSATNVNSMFKEAYAFNQDLSGWHTNQLFYFDSMFEDAESFDQDLSSWSIQSLTSAANFLDGTAMSTLNYSKLLRAWSQQTVNPGVQLDAHNTMYYSTVEWYRESLISDGWTIEDDGPTSIPAATLVTAPTASNINAGQQTLESVLSGGVASQPGTFSFVNPTEVLDSGAQTVIVRFTPADPLFYAPFTTTVNINVIAPATPAYSQTVVTNTATTALINAPTQENSPEPAVLNHTSRKSSHVASDSLNASSEPQTGASSPTQLLWLFGGAGFTLLVAAGVFIRVRTRAKVF